MTTGSTRWHTPTILAIAALVAVQSALAYALRDHVFFNDELEQLARAAQFSDLYTRQFSVHMPVPALASAVLMKLLGVTFYAGRAIAALLGCMVIASVFLTVRTFGPPRYNVVGGIAAGLFWIGFIDDAYAFLNLSQLHSCAFLALGTACAFRRRHDTVCLARPFATGALFALAVGSRVLAGEQIVVLGLGVLILRLRPSITWTRYVLHFAAGVTVVIVALAAVFHDRLRDLSYWTLLHNLHAKGAGLNPLGWVGDIQRVETQDLYVRVALIASALLASLALGIIRKTVWVLIFALLGAWLSANPSGVGEYLFNLIPAVAVLAALCGVVLAVICDWALRARYDGTAWPHVLASCALIATLAVNIRPAQRLHKHLDYVEALRGREKSDGDAAYIRNNSRSDDTMFVFGTNPLLYSIAERRSATVASILYADLAVYEDRILKELSASRPTFVVWDDKDFWIGKNVPAFPRLVRFIVDNYSPTPNGDLLQRIEEGDAPMRDDTARANAFFGWSQHCDGKELIVESATASEVMRFDAPNRWSEIKRGGEIESSPDLRFRVVSTDAFGGWIDDPKNHLRLHVRDSTQASHWAWVGNAQRVNRNTIEVPYSSLTLGDAANYSSPLVAVSFGGWGDPLVPITIDRIEILEPASRECN